MRIVPSVAIAVGLVGVLHVLVVAPAFAQETPACGTGVIGCPGASPRDHAVDLAATRHVNFEHIASGGGARGGSSALPCVYEAVPGDFERERILANQSVIPMRAAFYYLSCPERRYLRWYLPGTGDPVADGVLTEIVQQAFDTIVAPLPVLALSPPDDRAHLVGMPSWLAIDVAGFEAISGSVAAGEVGVTGWLVPVRVEWTMGDGESVTCPGPGNRYDPAVAFEAQAAECSYTYTHTPGHFFGDVAAVSYQIAARVMFDAGYEVTGPVLPGTYALGEVAGPWSSADLAVNEWRAVRTTPSR